MLVQVTDGRRQVVSLPRDLKVDVPGYGTNKINAAYAFGGPDLLVETVARATGIAGQEGTPPDDERADLLRGDLLAAGDGFIIRKFRTTEGQTHFWSNPPPY